MVSNSANKVIQNEAMRNTRQYDIWCRTSVLSRCLSCMLTVVLVFGCVSLPLPAFADESLQATIPDELSVQEPTQGTGDDKLAVASIATYDSTQATSLPSEADGRTAGDYFSSDPGPWWAYFENGGTVNGRTLDPGTLVLGNNATTTSASEVDLDGDRAPWRTVGTINIRHVVTVGNIRPTSMSYCFSDYHNDYDNLQSFDGSGMDLSACTSFHSVFERCTALEVVNFAGWGSWAAGDYAYYFGECSSIRSITLSQGAKPAWLTSFGDPITKYGDGAWVSNESGPGWMGSAEALIDRYSTSTEPDGDTTYTWVAGSFGGPLKKSDGSYNHNCFWRYIPTATTVLGVDCPNNTLLLYWDGEGTTAEVDLHANGGTGCTPWRTKITTTDIKHVVTAGGIQPTNMKYLFYTSGGGDYSNLESFDGSGMDVSKCSAFYSLFESSTKLSVVNLSGWKMQSSASLNYLFVNNPISRITLSQECRLTTSYMFNTPTAYSDSDTRGWYPVSYSGGIEAPPSTGLTTAALTTLYDGSNDYGTVTWEWFGAAPSYCTVIFHSNYGNDATTQVSCAAGSSVSLPTIRQSGYSLAGWFTAATSGASAGNGGTSYTIPNDAGATLDLYARWEDCPRYTVSYLANGGSGTMQSSAFSVDEDEVLAACAFTRDGYRFGGWNTKSDGTGTPYIDEATVRNLASANGSVSLYAQWYNPSQTLALPTGAKGGYFSGESGAWWAFFPEGGVLSNGVALADHTLVLGNDSSTSAREVNLNTTRLWESSVGAKRVKHVITVGGIKPTNLKYCFHYGYTSLASFDGSGMDISVCTDLHSLFDGCSNLRSVDLSGWATWDADSNGGDYAYFFYGCEKLKSITLNQAAQPSKMANFSDPVSQYGDGSWVSEESGTGWIGSATALIDRYSSNEAPSGNVTYTWESGSFGGPLKQSGGSYNQHCFWRYIPTATTLVGKECPAHTLLLYYDGKGTTAKVDLNSYCLWTPQIQTTSIEHVVTAGGIQPTSLKYCFYNESGRYSSLESFDGSGMDVSACTDFHSLFDNSSTSVLSEVNLAGWDMRAGTDFNWLFNQNPIMKITLGTNCILSTTYTFATPTAYSDSDTRGWYPVAFEGGSTAPPMTGLTTAELVAEYATAPNNYGTVTWEWLATAPSFKDAITPTFSIEGWTYGEASNSPVLGEGSNPGQSEGVYYEYKLTSANDSEYSEAVPTNAGEYTVRVTVPETEEFLEGTATSTFTIAQRIITVTANDQEVAYGDSIVNSVARVSLTGTLADNETLSSISLEALDDSIVPSDAVITKTVDEQSEATTANYAISYVNGSLTTTKKRVTITVSDDGKMYGEEDPTFQNASISAYVGEELDGIDLSVHRANNTVHSAGEYSGALTIGQTAEQLEEAYSNYTFQIVPGKFTISQRPVTVTIVGKTNTANYDGESHSVEGYTVTINDGLDTPMYTTDDFSLSGSATASRTNVVVGDDEDGQTDMGLTPNRFTNTNSNFNVTFDVTDGYQKILPINATVTIVGASNTAAYDGTTHTVSGYTAEASTDLYDVETDFTFSGNVSVSRKNVGVTDMDLSADQFTNMNPNFGTVTFDVTDGYQAITSLDEAVVVTITGHRSTVNYDGEEHAVTGYDVTATNPYYSASDLTFSGTATASQTNAGTTNMGLDVEQFTNTSGNFTEVSFVVVDGYQTVLPINATVTITGDSSVVSYDGEEHTVEGYTAEASTPLYNVNSDFTFSGEAYASQTNVGTANMNLSADQFTNTNPNFETVTFEVVDGYQTISKVAATVTAHSQSKTYGEVDPALTYSISGLVNDESLTGTLSREPGETAGTYVIGQGSLANTNYDISFVPGAFTINRKAVTVSADDLSKTYGENDPELGYSVSELAGTDTLAEATLTRAAGEDIGAYAITVSGAVIKNANVDMTANYDVTYAGAQLTINPKPVTAGMIVIADPIHSYTGAEVRSGATVVDRSLATNGARLTTEDYTLSGTSATERGVHTVTLSGQGNYSGAVTAQWVIDPVADANAAYDGAEHSVSVASLNASGISVTFAETNSSEPPKHTEAGTYTDAYTVRVGSGESAKTWNGTAKLTIGKRALTVTAKPQEITYGEEIDGGVNKVEVTGLSQGDWLASVALTPSTNAATNGTPASVIPLGAKIKDARGQVVTSNYTISYIPGALTIGRKAVTVTPVSATKVYGQRDPVFTYTASGLLDGDTLSGALTRDNASDSAAAGVISSGESVGVYAVSQGTLNNSSNPNYDITIIGDATLTITKKSLSDEDILMQLEPASFGSDESERTPAVALTWTPWWGAAALAAGTDYELGGTTSASAIGDYTLTATAVDEGNFSASKSATWRITAANVTVKATGFTGPYDGQAHGVLVTARAGEGATGDPVIEYKTTEDGEYSSTVPTFVDAGMYTVYYRVAVDDGAVEDSAAVVIEKKPITVKADAKRKSYGEEDPELTYVATGLVEGTSLVGSLARAEGENVGSYAILAGSLTNDVNPNYDIAFTSAQLSITKAFYSPTISLSNWAYGELVVPVPSISGIPEGVSDELTAADVTPTVMYKAADAPDSAYSTELPSDVGNYVVRLAVPETTNYVYAEATSTFAIAGKALSASMLQPIADQEAVEGAECSPVIVLKDGDTVLAEGVDYELSGALTATSFGTYTVHVAGKGNYAGEFDTSWRVLDAAAPEPVVEEEHLEGGGMLMASVNTSANASDSIVGDVAGVTTELVRSLLTDDELAEVQAGGTATVYLEVDKLAEESVDTDDLTLAAEELGTSGGVAASFDLTLWKRIGNEAATQVHESGSSIHVVLAVDDSDPVPEGYERTYYVVRVHEGVAEVLGSSTTTEISFDTDLFSSYFVGYRDIAVAGGSDNASGSGTGSGDNTGGSGGGSSDPSGGNNPATTVTVTVVGGGGGTLTGGTVTGAGTYKVGDIVTLTAAPNQGATFRGWRSVDNIELLSTQDILSVASATTLQVMGSSYYLSTSPTISFRANSDVTIEAHFVYTVIYYGDQGDDPSGGGSGGNGDNTSGSAGGNTSGNTGGESGGGSGGGSGDPSGGNNPATTVTVTVVGGGGGTLTGGTVTGAGTYKVGDIVTLTAAPNQGATFRGWRSVDNIELLSTQDILSVASATTLQVMGSSYYLSTSPTISFRANSDVTIEAHFVYTVIYYGDQGDDPSGGGSGGNGGNSGSTEPEQGDDSNTGDSGGNSGSTEPEQGDNPNGGGSGDTGGDNNSGTGLEQGDDTSQGDDPSKSDDSEKGADPEKTTDSEKATDSEKTTDSEQGKGSEQGATTGTTDAATKATSTAASTTVAAKGSAPATGDMALAFAISALSVLTLAAALVIAFRRRA